MANTPWRSVNQEPNPATPLSETDEVTARGRSGGQMHDVEPRRKSESAQTPIILTWYASALSGRVNLLLPVSQHWLSDLRIAIEHRPESYASQQVNTG